MINQQLKQHTGISLVEILLSLAIFSIGIVGLYLSIQAMNKNLQLSAQRDLEAAYANQLINEVNPHLLTVRLDEGSGGFDLTDNNNKGTIALPDGRTVYYLREVKKASNTAGDVLMINIYFYHKANDAEASPYRHFKRELTLANHGFQMTSSSTTITKDSNGNIWTGMPRTQAQVVGDATDSIAGMDIATTGALQNPSADAECGEYHLGNATSDALIYLIPATQGHKYKVELQLCEPNDAAVATDRVMELTLSGVLVDEIDIVEEAGGPNIFITKSYDAEPGQFLGVYFLHIRLDRKSGTTDNSPVLSRIRVIR